MKKHNHTIISSGDITYKADLVDIAGPDGDARPDAVMHFDMPQHLPQTVEITLESGVVIKAVMGKPSMPDDEGMVSADCKLESIIVSSPEGWYKIDDSTEGAIGDMIFSTMSMCFVEITQANIYAGISPDALVIRKRIPTDA